MKIPGMHYQDPSWKTISTVLADAMAHSLAEFGVEKLRPEAMLLHHWPELWIASETRLLAKPHKLQREHNVHGIDGLSLALDLLEAIASDQAITDGKRVRISALQRLAQGMPKGNKISQTKLREKCQNVLSEMRDRIDIAHYMDTLDEEADAPPIQHAGTQKKPRKKRPMSTYRLDQLRQIDTCLHQMAGFMNNWQQHPQALALVLGHEVFPGSKPIEVARFQRHGYCEAAWLLRWSEHFAPKEKDGKGPLHGNKVTDKTWALNGLEAQIDETIADLRAYATACERFAPHMGPDFMRRLQGEVVDEAYSRLQAKPEVDLGPEDDASFAQEHDETKSDSPGTETLYAEPLDGWHNAEAANEADPEAEPEAEPEVEPEAMFLPCLQTHHLTLQAGILLEIYPHGEQSMVRLCKRLKLFETWQIAPLLDELSGALLATKHVPPLTVAAFWLEVKAAKNQFLACCAKRLGNA